MNSNILHILAERHDDWIRMARSFKINNNDARELVQEMYIRMYNYTTDVSRIMYNKEEINTFYIYITLRNLYYTNYTNIKRKRHICFTDINNEKDQRAINNISFNEVELFEDYNKKIDLDKLYDKIDSIIEDWYWYDKKLTKLYLNTNMSMRDISKETKISLSSIFNTLTNAKQKIRKETKEEYKKYRS
jgi:DNA-directed RNA polymerase specialized sigma24 family protein